MSARRLAVHAGRPHTGRPTAGAPRVAAADHGRCWCGAARWRVEFRTPRFGLLRCAACGTFRLDPPPLDGDDVEAFYTGFYAAGTSAAEAATRDAAPEGRFWRVARQVPELARPRLAALDVGCGEGRLCGELHAAGWPDVRGVDPSRSRLARARAAYPHLRFHAALDEAAPRPASLDLVVLDNVIEHLHEPLAMVRRVAPLLRPTGDVVMITPNLESGHYRLLGRRWTPELCPDQHVHLFTPRAIARLVRRAGLRVTHAGTLQTPLYPRAAWLRHARAGNVRELAWRAAQECGALWSRATGAGGMLYVVARPSVRPPVEAA